MEHDVDVEGLSIELPSRWSDSIKVDKNIARQLLCPPRKARLVNENQSVWAAAEDQRWPVIKSPAPEYVHLVRKKERFAWGGPSEAHAPAGVRASLEGAFRLPGLDAQSPRGLRAPQTGALLAVFAHWTTGSQHPATVVMPTGTGKTDTMVAIYAAARPERLLVLVPSDVLRGQTAGKFETLGILPELGIVAGPFERPVVGRVEHHFESGDSARSFAQACNVVVTTPAALSGFPEDVRTIFLAEFSHLFIDEAHHVAARTWSEIRDAFDGRPVVQFTATPFRSDGRPLGGRVVYAFPLREAQAQGYFAGIDYISVLSFDDPDRDIAERALSCLRTDLDNGRDHLLMARTSSINRANELLNLYEELAPDLNPMVIHSKLSGRKAKAALDALDQRHSRLIICVGMLGEGFDLPQLKVAALHDTHKSLGITLQFIGRFARVSSATVGNATVVSSRSDAPFDEQLRQLYAEDADWNLIVRDLSQQAVGEQEDVSDFEAAFGSGPEEVSIKSVLPKMSAVAYRTGCQDWTPTNVYQVFPEENLLTYPIAVNRRDRVLWFVTQEQAPVQWGQLPAVEEVVHHLYVMYWDEAHDLLYINSTNNDSLHEDLATAVCGQTADRITGKRIYRVMGGIDRLVPTNVGVLDVRNRNRRFSMHVGADVAEGFADAEKHTKAQTNIFATGFAAGVRTSVGASLKGRIWSRRTAESLKHWVDWCDEMGLKLLDDSINIAHVMDNFIQPEDLEDWPELTVLAVEWPLALLARNEDSVQLSYGGVSYSFLEAELEVTPHIPDEAVHFVIGTPAWQVPYAIFIEDGLMRVRAAGDGEVMISTSRRDLSATEFFARRDNVLQVLFENDALVCAPARLLHPVRDIPPFDSARLQVPDWTGIDITKESQGRTRDADSIQARMIQVVLARGPWDVVVDDDGSGEVADIVALRETERELHILLVHCKYSSEPQAGARVEDLYEVCGQANKSAAYRRDITAMLNTLINRARNRQRKYGHSGIEAGTSERLVRLRDTARTRKPHLTIAIAQPGMSQTRASRKQMELLASTEVYLREIANAGFEVYCNV
ncbi:DEAD/DEAH box helicase [Nonomuraea sp. NPDC050451]|uniref:DEAD/DEAH box helicase n=1 Tax=Nonomuraea sp. NPDC050451 TaxID=3364364 RepID=UPI0037A0F836